MAPALAIISAVAGLATAGSAVISAFNKPKQQTPASITQGPVKAPTLEDTNAQGTSKKALGALSLINTSPQGVLGSPNLGRSKLLGG